MASSVQYILGYLDTSCLPSAFHPRRHINGVPPNIVMRLPRPDDPRRNGPVVYAHLQHEVVEGLLVDALQGLL